MHVFNSRADFDAQMKSVKKWMRTGQALDGVADLQHDVAYSIGDSLVYWWVYAREAATADLVGHRRYHAVLAPLDGDLTVEVAPKAGLTCTRAYSDIDDRERFEGGGDRDDSRRRRCRRRDRRGLPCYRRGFGSPRRGTARDGRRLFLPQQVVFVRLDVCFAPLRGMALLTPFSPFPLAGAPSAIALAARTVLDDI